MSTESASRNFAFLRPVERQLDRRGALAERYFTDDPSTCLIKLRQLGEELARQTAARTGLLVAADESQADLLRRLKFERAAPAEVLGHFHQVRTVGNRAAHALLGAAEKASEEAQRQRLARESAEQRTRRSADDRSLWETLAQEAECLGTVEAKRKRKKVSAAIDQAERYAAAPLTFGFQLRPYQGQAIAAVERELDRDRRAMLIAMATGTGKTKLAIALLYRLLTAKRFRRVCFVVDRSALGEQTGGEFSSTRVVGTKTFADIFDLKGLGCGTCAISCATMA